MGVNVRIAIGSLVSCAHNYKLTHGHPSDRICWSQRRGASENIEKKFFSNIIIITFLKIGKR